MHPAKRILLVEDDPKDIELTLSALAEHNPANAVEVAMGRSGSAGLSIPAGSLCPAPSGKSHGDHARS